MRTEKAIYSAPTFRYFAVRIEGCMCLSGGAPGDPGKAGNGWTPGGDYIDYGDL